MVSLLREIRDLIGVGLVSLGIWVMSDEARDQLAHQVAERI